MSRANVRPSGPGPASRERSTSLFSSSTCKTGVAKFLLLVNGKSAAAWSADAKLPSHLPNGDNSARYTARAVELKPGDVIRVEGTPDGSDPAALDYIEVFAAKGQSGARP
jgi:hypothetical protein